MIEYTKFEITVMSIYIFWQVVKITFKIGLCLFLPVFFLTLIGDKSLNGYQAAEISFYGAFGMAFLVCLLVNLIKIGDLKTKMEKVIIADRKIQEREKLQELENGEKK